MIGAFVSTWGSKCGISTYSEELTEWLINKDVRIQILAPNEAESCTHPPQNIPYQLVWNRGDPNLFMSILPCVEQCDFVHVQHEYGLFQDHGGFIDLLRHLNKRKIGSVVTLHTVHPYGKWNSGVLDSIRTNADVVITHTPAAYAAVSLARGRGRVLRIPHGTRVNALKGNRAAGLEFMNIPRQYWSASFGGAIGFMGSGKNLIETMQAFGEGINRGWIDASKTGLIICGDSKEDGFFRLKLEAIRRDCGYTQNIFVIDKFIPRDKMKHVMAAIDWAVLNTRSTTLSASGQVHAHAAYGIPMAVADRPIYGDAIAAGAIPFQLEMPEDRYTLSTVNAISALARSDQMRKEISESLFRFARNTGWDKIADMHIEIYKEFAK